MKILITGGSGFIGTNLVDYYIKKGWNVKNLDIKVPQNSQAKDYWQQCDITDYEKLSEIILQYVPDYIVHLAARTDLDGKSVDDYQANTIGVDNVLKASHQLKGLKKILITSSMLVCHTGYIPKNQYDYAPSTFYGESKVITEQLTWKHQPACDWAILRPTSMWGPWFGVPYRKFFDVVKAGMYFHIDHRSCTKTYGYIENALYQIDQILSNPTQDEANKVFYLGDSPAIFIEEWANQIAAELGRKIPRVPFWLIRLAAWGGDILGMFGLHFPMTSFRLKNMTTDNIIPLDNTIAIAPHPPVDRITGIKRTLAWMKESKI
ncbi:MAG: NAD(P)-dependent oxidoreductase [Prevotella sp.]|jgi:nucleoside-diphosphate-sugar epimerase|nr:NAD(P)-dependent oxidoreductase [Prevotella sp.]